MGKKIKVVIGANFGDEGKGLMTDYFCNKLSAEGKVLNVRYNGGAQAGHTVVTPDGKRHVFHHFGSGTLNPGVSTFLSDDFIVNPILFCREWNDLKEKFGIEPEVYISPNCQITTPYDMIINQMIETHRGDKRHGSCGIGIYETVERNRLTESFSADIGGVESKKEYFKDFLRNIRDFYLPDRLSHFYRIVDKDCIIPEKTYPDFCEWIRSDTVLENFVIQYHEMMSRCTVAFKDELYKNYDRIVFEGAQGLLLSEDNIKYYPHVTGSLTGIKIPMQDIMQFGLDKDKNLEVCYVTRPYLTRHGAGPLETECEKNRILPDDVCDKTNQKNEYQGELRYGFFDPLLFNRSIFSDCFNRCTRANRSIAFTHLDETDSMVITEDSMEEPQAVCKHLTKMIYKSFGETRNDVWI